jgi:hypothetical protein
MGGHGAMAPAPPLLLHCQAALAWGRCGEAGPRSNHAWGDGVLVDSERGEGVGVPTSRLGPAESVGWGLWGCGVGGWGGGGG